MSVGVNGSSKRTNSPPPGSVRRASWTHVVLAWRKVAGTKMIVKQFLRQLQELLGLCSETVEE
jgi:hypothetical protein